MSIGAMCMPYIIELPDKKPSGPPIRPYYTAAATLQLQTKSEPAQVITCQPLASVSCIAALTE